MSRLQVNRSVGVREETINRDAIWGDPVVAIYCIPEVEDFKLDLPSMMRSFLQIPQRLGEGAGEIGMLEW